MERKQEIGDNQWEAALMVDDKSEYKDFKVKRNGRELELSPYSEEGFHRNNGTVSGRSFTLEDLEKMLDVEFVIDQRAETIEMWGK